ncbi:PsbP-related protein [Mongoliibacter ruber]|uniref:PsbP protein n=1 Tax=Mongoliibacter ruber TaxID=1750599 RepID=A0A2T0WGT5_9BACT|nr:PsbP-related protein [Mongoliibacter ruber]PRY85882.1 hypothetical protein CLW00_11012 [Mongoliibacter ruber]
MNRLLIWGAIFLTSNLSLFGQTKDWNTIEKDNYSINYPKDWELNESGQMGTSFILFSPLTSEKDQFKENVNLLVQDLTGHNLDLDEYVKISEGQIKTMITNGKIIESKRVTNQSLNYHKVIFSGKQGDFNLKFEQNYWVVGDKAFVLTLTCEETQFDNYKLKGEKILNSFKLNKN